MRDEKTLVEERQAILAEMETIQRLRRGTVNTQYFQVKKKDGHVVERGPYYLYSRTEKGRSFSERVPADRVEQVRTETENCKRFKELSERYVVVCEQLTVGTERAGEKGGSKRRSRRRLAPKSSA